MERLRKISCWVWERPRPFGILRLIIVVFVIALFCIQDFNEVKEIDLSEINTKRILVGENKYQEAFDVPLALFSENHYDIVLISAKKWSVIYLGERSDGQWFRASETLEESNSWPQSVKKVETNDQKLFIYFGYHTVFTIIYLGFILFTLIRGVSLCFFKD